MLIIIDYSQETQLLLTYNVIVAHFTFSTDVIFPYNYEIQKLDTFLHLFWKSQPHSCPSTKANFKDFQSSCR